MTRHQKRKKNLNNKSTPNPQRWHNSATATKPTTSITRAFSQKYFGKTVTPEPVAELGEKVEVWGNMLGVIEKPNNASDTELKNALDALAFSIKHGVIRLNVGEVYAKFDYDKKLDYVPYEQVMISSISGTVVTVAPVMIPLPDSFDERYKPHIPTRTAERSMMLEEFSENRSVWHKVGTCRVSFNPKNIANTVKGKD